VSRVDHEALQGRWTHSHEEDTGDELVFRPASQPLPPARGRRSLELRAGGSYAEFSPGPVDVPVESRGRWSLENDRLELQPDGDLPRESWRVTAVEPERLLLRREDAD